MTDQAFAPQGRTDLAGRPLDRFDWLVREATDADEATFSPGSLRGIKYAILAVAQAIRDASAVDAIGQTYEVNPTLQEKAVR